MRKFYLLLLLIVSVSITAQQIREIQISQNGKKTIVHLEINGTFLSMDTDGNISQINSNQKGNMKLNEQTTGTFQGDVEIDYDDPKSISTKKAYFDYYDDFYSYRSGKLKSVDDISIDYYDGFYSYQNGKLKSIGNLKFTYFDGFYDYQKGKLKSINNLEFTYYDDFYKYRSGKLKSIKGNNNKIQITVFND